jgi:hypothetical protein
MGDFLFDGFSLEMTPAITKWSYEDLGDDPTLHRWRAFWSPCDIDGKTGGIELRAYPVIKPTRCGVWVDEMAWRDGKGWNTSSTGKRFVHNDSGQAWAKPTQEDAIKSIAIRLTRWSNRIAGDVRRAKTAADVLEKLRPDLADFAETARKNLGDGP